MKEGDVLKIVDFHCDVLSKIQLDRSLDFKGDNGLDVNLERMKQGGVDLQCFAIYLSEKLGPPGIEHIMEQLDLFQERIASEGIGLIRNTADLERVAASGERSGLLSIEGADGLEGDLFYLRLCYERGVRFLGITWNYANWAADGVMELRNGGFTRKGLELVQVCHELGIILDVSHLSQKGFWELVELSESAKRPFIASHSNAYHICAHARNLHDEQIRAIIDSGGRIGVTFVPWFVKDSTVVHSEDLLPHLDHICQLGGEKQIMFGSDFDGIDTHIDDLRHAGDYYRWVETLLKHYPEELVKGWMSGNALEFLQKWLPSDK
nr:dipeptidase [Paenibacillus sp. GM2]